MMLRAELLLHTKLALPRSRRRVLPRPTLTARLREALDYRLTVVQAGTGYGKSTALTSLAEADTPLFWYSLDEADSDPQRFLAYLIAAFRARLPGLSESPLVVLQEVQNGGTWSQALDALINALAEAVPEPSLLILDDYHFVAHSSEVNALSERFITYLPLNLRVIISTRHPLKYPSLVIWRAKGEVLEIGHQALAFQPSEIEVLFRTTYGQQLSAADLAALAHKTEGWPIALQLVWQGLRNGTAQNVVDLLAQGPASASLNALFDFLARDVLGRQPLAVAAFLRQTAVLHELTPAACNAVTGETNGQAMLDYLHDLDLFVVALGPSEGRYRYHHLFHDFLREQLAADPAEARDRHRRAAAYFRALPNSEEAIYHWLVADEFTEAATEIERIGEATLRSGRLDTVALWIDALPPVALAEHPLLQAYLGDVYRLRSRFDDAQAWYAQAEQTWRARGDPAGISRALRGQALVYLDTVRPAQAESLLEEALRLMDGMPDREARARMLELTAENKLNMGKPNEAEALRASARALREEGPAQDVVGVRVKLRTGQIDEAQRLLEAGAEAEREQMHPPRAHRETVLILSLIHSFRGQADRAFALAKEGIALGERVGSPFITAVGQMRLGHAWQIQAPTFSPKPNIASPRDEAIRCYQAAITLGDQLAVRRTRAEAMWGLTRAYGFSEGGDLASAERTAAEGVETGRWAGDPWIVALVELMLGASYVLAGRPAEAVEILSRVLIAFRECGDSLGRAATRLWLSLAYLDLKQRERLTPSVEDLFALCETHGYDFLFTARTILGSPDPRRLVPLLIEARDHRLRPAYAARLLADLGLPKIKAHPGYQLRVQTLGIFRVWRGEVEIEPREWPRDKARQLFQLFLIQRGRPLQREEITEQLWPSLSPEVAIRDFKVALNALNKTLEPGRSPEAPFAFIIREGVSYLLRPEADVWVEAAAFEGEAEAGLRSGEANADLDSSMAHLRSAIHLYQGDFLPEALYEEWASQERERLLALYLRAADKLASLLIERGHFDEALHLCQSILARDVSWEHAYRLMMIAHVRLGNRHQAIRAYLRCVEALRAELSVEPSPTTVALYNRIVQASDPAVTDL